MQEYYNVIQASKYIGADPKTVRRWLKQGKLTGTRTERGWLAIPAEQVEMMRIEWKNEREKFAIPSPPYASLDRDGRESLDIMRRVEALEQKVAELEKALPNASLVVPTQPIPQPSTSATTPKTKPTKQPTKRKSDLPEGCILASKFAEQYGIPRETFRDYMLYGLGKGLIGYSTDVIPQKEMIEYSERPKPGRPKEKERYFNLEQQEKAVSLLRKHGKLS